MASWNRPQPTPAEQREHNVRAAVRAVFLRACCMFPGKVRIRISYTSQKGVTPERTIRPLRIEHNTFKCACGRKVQKTALKVRAFCEMKEAERLFFPSQMKIKGVYFGDFQ